MKDGDEAERKSQEEGKDGDEAERGGCGNQEEGHDGDGVNAKAKKEEKGLVEARATPTGFNRRCPRAPFKF